MTSLPTSNDVEAPYTMLDSVCVIIPALNEERSLPLVLGDLPKVGRVVVVDNGSIDATADVATRCGATVVGEPQRGYGAACLRGLAALSRNPRALPQPQRPSATSSVFQRNALAILAGLLTCLYGVIALLSWRFRLDSVATERPIIAVLLLFTVAFLVYLFSVRIAVRGPDSISQPCSS